MEREEKLKNTIEITSETDESMTATFRSVRGVGISEYDSREDNSLGDRIENDSTATATAQSPQLWWQYRDSKADD